ncbi:hypothetical protein CQS04_07525 [Chryseomicrobium excrementi]|uniref:Uncharacterized protein n=1 Tax=Chryseomicrobium excrementi TaxID=2041346 RepID=A0A2M9F0L2_9BACL|nr:hypothetical protein CQS04_07525 [Chryseomicrobium excrementi]
MLDGIVVIKGIESEVFSLKSEALKQLLIVPIVAAALTLGAYQFTDFFTSDTLGFTSFEKTMFLVMMFLSLYGVSFLSLFAFHLVRMNKQKNHS